MFKRKLMNARVLAACLAASMTFGTCSGVSFAATGSEVAKDGTYTATAHVARTEQDDEDENEWNEYDVDVSLTVADGVFSDITVKPKNGYESENASYFDKTYTKSKGIKKKLEGQAATEDTINSWKIGGTDGVSGATRTADAVKAAALEAIHQAEAKEDVPETIDTAALEAAIADAKALTEADYTAESWSALQEALTAAEAALEAKESQDAVTAAATALQDAIKKLEKAPEVTVDTAALEAAIAKAEALQEADYTEESWSTAKDEIAKALTEAKAALDAKESQEAVTAAADALTAAMEKLEEKVEDEYTYVYAALSYAEYYAAEDVQAAGSTAAGAGKDTRNEADLGAFDTVTRATTVHGLHRSNFQQNSVMYDTDGNSYRVGIWEADGKNLNLVDSNGANCSFSGGTITKADGSAITMDHYEIEGIKYVPVAVKTADYEDFKAQYDVIENGGTLAGGFSENKLNAYTAIAEVDKDTNGLKVAEKNGDAFTFGARQTGTGSGIQGQEQKTAEQANLGVAVQETSSYGDFIRVDLKSNYGDLGGAMQAVVWKYYGSAADTTGTPLATYGTKFAADNWMHKGNGIQLGLTNSLRCTLPEGSDGSGKWTLTIYALGYADTTIEVDVAKEDIHMATPISDTSKLEEAVAAAEALTEADYTADSWSKMQAELKEAQDALADAAKGKGSQETIDECVEHLGASVKDLQLLYVWMNIPYDAFYAAEVNNDIKVDAFTSATLNKTRTGSLVGGSYHVDSKGTDITGITYPVKVTEEQLAALKADADKYKQITEDSSVTIKVTNRGQTNETTYTGKDALFEAPSYAYFAGETVVPAYYKELAVDADGTFSFGKVQAAEQKLEGASATLTTESSYGDYQMEVSGLPEEVSTVYAVVLNTKEGNGYGLRHMENIWRKTELAWCTGFTKAVHNCPTSSEHYKAIMGQTISQIVYYTDQGVYTIDTDMKVPTTLSAELSVESGKAGAGTVKFALSEQLPADFVAEYSVDGLQIQVENGQISYTGGMPGKYVVKIVDKSGTYAPLSGEFLLTTAEMPAKWDAEQKSLVQANEGEQGKADFENYVKQISSVVVNGKEYAASGRGSVVIINRDGTLNTAASPFADGKEFTIEVKATGYENSLSFTYTVATTPDNGNNSGDNGNNSGNNGNNSSNNGNSNNGSSNNGTTNGGNTSNGSDTNNGSSSNGSSNNGSSGNGSFSNGSSDNGSSSSGSSAAEDTTIATPKTGDSANIMLWAVMAVAAVILGVFGISLQKVGRRTHKKKH